MLDLRSVLIRFSVVFVFAYFATETQIAIAHSVSAIAWSRPYRILADLPQRGVPSWCKNLRHPNINVCGSTHNDERTIKIPTPAKLRDHAAILSASLPYLNANGWTVFTPATGTGSCGNSSSNYTGTCVVFVAAAGNDSTCAAQLPSVTSPSAGQACATIAHGISLLRPGASADWLLLNRGDTFVRSGLFRALRSERHIPNDAALDLSLWLGCPPDSWSPIPLWFKPRHRQLGGRRMRRRRQQHRDRRHRVLCLHARS